MSDLIDWGTTGQIFVESLGAGVLVVAAFSLGARLVSAAQDAGAAPGGGAAGKYALAALCFAVAAIAVAFGVYFTVDK